VRDIGLANDVFAEVCSYLGEVGASAGFSRYDETIVHIAQLIDAKSLLELGAGRSPALVQGARELDLGYAINDIDQRELDMAPDGIDKLPFDIAASLPAGVSRRFDLVVSRSVLEHVRGVEMALANSAQLLAPGGFALHFAPTLFALPFAINKIAPERAALRLLRLFAPRDETVHPKFPAIYEHCRSTRRNEARLSAHLAPSRFAFVSYYEHTYYNRIQPLASASRIWQGYFARHQVRAFSSYCFFVIQNTNLGDR
jgi:SAM-dependent methyltransferase